jgi:flavodoxin
MNSLVIYGTYFGNTEKIAQAIAEQLETEAVNVKEFKKEMLDDIDLFVVGSPTRAFRPIDSINEFLSELPNLDGKKVAAFDTRVNVDIINSKLLKFLAKIFGYAAEPILKKLVKKGGEKVLEPDGFCVKDSEGPLLDGEIERAKQWVRGV